MISTSHRRGIGIISKKGRSQEEYRNYRVAVRVCVVVIFLMHLSERAALAVGDAMRRDATIFAYFSISSPLAPICASVLLLGCLF